MQRLADQAGSTVVRRRDLERLCTCRAGRVPALILSSLFVALLAGAWLLPRHTLMTDSTPDQPKAEAASVPHVPAANRTQPRPSIAPLSEKPVVPSQPSGEGTTTKSVVSAAPMSKTNPGTASVIKQAASKTTSKLPAGFEKILIGDWSSYYQGERQLTVAADGTGTMIAKPEGLAATLLASKLTFQIKWKITADQLEFETVGGEPAEKIKVVVKMYGGKRTHKILEVQPNRFELLDEDGATKYVWTRVEQRSESAGSRSGGVNAN